MTEVVDLLRTMIRNKCVNDGSVTSGHEARSVRTLTDYFGVDGTVFEPADQRQSLVYRIPGTTPGAPSLALVPHIDVVPADGLGWTVDPFAAKIVDGCIYGRGAVDMLNVTAAMAVAVKPYISGERRPRGDLVFCAVADEESGGGLGAQPLVEEHWDLVGSDFMLTEVAYPGLPGVGHHRVPVSVGEKGAFWSRLSTRGTPGHGSAPYGADSAITKIVEALSGILSSPSPALITDEWPLFVSSIGLDDEMVSRLVDVDSLDDAIYELAIIDPLLARYVHAATHLTVSPNLMKAGSKSNVIPDHAMADVDIRALPNMDRESIDLHLRKAMGRAADDVHITPLMDNQANISPINNPLWEAIADGVEGIEGHRDLVPTMMTVATDARFWRERGTVAYGVGLFDDRMSFSEMLALFHGYDERVSVESVEKTLRLYELVLDGFLGE